MPQNLTLISVRLDPDTIKQLDKLVNHPGRFNYRAGRAGRPAAPTRSNVIRHALRTGIEVLSSLPPLTP